MKKYKHRYAILFILSVSFFGILIFKNILIKKVIVFYLNKKHISCYIEDFKIHKFNFVIKNLRLQNNRFLLNSRFAVIKVNRNLTLDIYAKDTNLKIKNEASNDKRQSFNINKINRLTFDNISITTDKIKANHLNLSLSKKHLALKGYFELKEKKFDIKAYINSLYSNIDTDKNRIILKNTIIKPKKIYLTYKRQSSLILNNNIQIKQAKITLSPFSIKIDSAKSKAIAKIEKFNISFFFNLFIKSNFIILTTSDLKSNGLEIKKLTLKTDKEYKNIKADLENVSIEDTNITTQNLKAKITIKNNKAYVYIGNGEAVFFDNWYIDFYNLPTTATLNIKDLSAEIDIKDIIKTHIKKGKTVKFHIYSNKPKDIFKLLIKDAYSSQLLQSSTISNTGQIKIDLELFKNKSVYAETNLTLHNLKIGAIKIDNINAKIPICYNIDKKRNGYIKIHTANILKYKLNLFSKVISNKNTLKIITKIKTNDKSLKILPITTLIDLSKETLSSNLLFSLKTKDLFIDTHLKKILLANQNIKTDGNIHIKAFDGNITIKNIHILDLYELPVLVMDIDFCSINLKKITQNTGFGLITGYIKGYINNLSLVNFKKPLSFVAVVKTDSAIKSQKKIALKAIKNISSIGGGYTNIVIPFFKTFPYSRIGFKATLKNNKFSLHGLYKNKDKEYIIEKELLIGVSVVNMNKNNSIDWEDMLNRIKRVMDKNNIKIE